MIPFLGFWDTKHRDMRHAISPELFGHYQDLSISSMINHISSRGNANPGCNCSAVNFCKSWICCIIDAMLLGAACVV